LERYLYTQELYTYLRTLSRLTFMYYTYINYDFFHTLLSLRMYIG